MPSGAKKRRAAKRKQAAIGGILHPPDSPPPHAQGNGGIHDPDPIGHDDHLPTDEEGEEEQPGPGLAVGSSMESSERADDAGKPIEDGTVREVILSSPPSETPSFLHPPLEPGNGRIHYPFGNNHLPIDEEVREEEEYPEPRFAVSSSMESSERADDASKPMAEGAVREVILSSPPLAKPISPSATPISKTEVVIIEFFSSKEGEDGGGRGIEEEEPRVTESPAETGSEKPPAADVPVVIPVVHIDSLNEEVIQASEAIAETSEAVVDSLALEGELKVVPLVETAVEQTREDGEPCPGNKRPETAVTTEVAPAPRILIRQHASWWSCCGLFDVLTAS